MVNKKAEIVVLRDIKDKTKEELKDIIEVFKDYNNLQKEKINQLEAEVTRLQQENKEYQDRFLQDLISSVSELSKDALAVLSIYKMLDETVLKEHLIRTKLKKYLSNVKVKPALAELKYTRLLIQEDDVTYRLSDKAKIYQTRNNKMLNTGTTPAQTSQHFDALLDHFSNKSLQKIKTLLKMWPQVLLGRAEIKFVHGKTVIFKACASGSEYLIVRYNANRVSPEVLIESYGGEKVGETVKLPLSNLKNEDLVNFVSLLKKGDTHSPNRLDLAEINSWAVDS